MSTAVAAAAERLKERPILFSGEMVRALLDGRKTMTRRILKPQPVEYAVRVSHGWEDRWHSVGDRGQTWGNSKGGEFRCPYGQPGDRLWVRETWAVPEWYDDLAPCDIPATDHDAPRAPLQGPVFQRVWYLADAGYGRTFSDGGHFAGKTRVSIHMPRWASRLTLEITAVRVERVQDISEKDAQAEGVGGMRDMRFAVALGNIHSTAHRLNFAELWDAINGNGAWESNPWVWCVSFRKVDPGASQ